VCKSIRSALILSIFIILVSLINYAQSAASNVTEAPAQVSANGGHLGNVGVGVKVSLLGAGIEGAVRLTEKTNVRAGFNMIQYSRGFDKDGVSYKGELNFRTLEAHLDYFPWAKSFHLSPGLQIRDFRGYFLSRWLGFLGLGR
jgi:uncharacterized protein with GYD domain